MRFPASPRGLLSYLVTLHVLRLGSGGFVVVGPGHPLRATVGQDVVLPCHVSPRKDAQGLEIRWIRHRLSKTVHHYRNGEDQDGEQLRDYRGRTELVRAGLSNGSLDLRILGLRPSDDGQYVCTVQDAGTYREATVDLEVAATGSVPQLSLEAYEDGGIRVRCRSAGWYPQPQVLWKDPGGQRLPSLSQRRSSDERGLFDVEDVTVVSGSGGGNFSCVVRNSRLEQEQESSLHVSAPFFHDARPWMAALPVLLVLLAAVTGVGAWLWRRKVLQSRELAVGRDRLFSLLVAWRKFLVPENPDVVTLDPDTAHSQLVLSADRRRMRFPASPRGLLSYLVTLHVLRLGSGGFVVVGPGHPLRATVGQDVVLPCHVSPRKDAQGLEIRWIRHRLSETVHHYRNGEDQDGEQLRDYRGRTELVRAGLSNGSLDLRILGLRPSDDGQYVCTVQDAGTYREATVDLEVAATGSVPQLSLEAYEDGGIRVRCRSAGWYPQPQVLWKDPGGQRLPSLSQRRSSDERGLFDVEDVTVVSGSGGGNFSCVVRNSRLEQEQESSLHVSAPFFHDARPWMAALPVLLVLLAAVTGVGAWLWRRKAVGRDRLFSLLVAWRKFLVPENPDVVTLDPDTAHSQLVLSADRRRMRFPASPRGLLSYLVTLHVLRLGSGGFVVVGPGHPLRATVGQDVVLPCHVSPRKDAQGLEIRWIRHRLSETVHHYRNGEDQDGEQLRDYRGRTELVRAGLSNGSLDLRILGLRPSDDGQYVCTVQDAGTYREATVDLEVAATGSVPQLSLEAYEDGGIRVRCRSAGWYPQPQVLWKDPGGQRLPSLSQRRSSDERGLFDVEDVTVVSGSGGGNFSCVVRNSRLEQEQESSLHVSAPFFHDARPWMAALPVLLVLLAAVTGVGAWLWRRKVLQSRELGESFWPLPWAKAPEKGAPWEGRGSAWAWGSAPALTAPAGAAVG
ncbi:unnamed protein product [Bubo scandiacus]